MADATAPRAPRGQVNVDNSVRTTLRTGRLADRPFRIGALTRRARVNMHAR